MHKKHINKQKSYHQFDLIACTPFISVWFCRDFFCSYLLLSFSHTFVWFHKWRYTKRIWKKSHTLNFVGFERSPRTFSDGSESPNVKWVCFYLRRFFHFIGILIVHLSSLNHLPIFVWRMYEVFSNEFGMICSDFATEKNG